MRHLDRGSRGSWVTFSDIWVGRCGLWVTCVGGHVGRGSIFVTHFHLCLQPISFLRNYSLFIPACHPKDVALAILPSYSYKRELFSWIVAQKTGKPLYFLIYTIFHTEKFFQRPLLEGL